MADSPGDLTPDDPGPENGDGRPAGEGMSWSWDSGFDFEALLDAVSGAAPWLRDAEGADQAVDADPEADEAAYREAVAAGRVGEMPLSEVAGRIVESLPTGPGLAGWLAQAPAPNLEDGALAGVAASFRRLASWAAAGELAAVAQIASRSARTDRRASVDPSGRPDRVTADASGQVSLALAMSPDGASGWTDLAVTLTWRLSATGAALAAGEIDLSRARMIARVTERLDDEAARQVEAAVLGRAGWLTLGQLHAALRRAVLKADPEGAERRRRDAERKASVVLYPEDEGTATLAGYSLPGVQAAAAMPRITALAKALQAAGTAGQIDLVRAQVFLGLLLGTLPYIPPAPGAAPDDNPPDDPAPGGRRAGTGRRGRRSRYAVADCAAVPSGWPRDTGRRAAGGRAGRWRAAKPGPAASHADWRVVRAGTAVPGRHHHCRTGSPARRPCRKQPSHPLADHNHHTRRRGHRSHLPCPFPRPGRPRRSRHRADRPGHPDRPG
jgi:hypothetical protein